MKLGTGRVQLEEFPVIRPIMDPRNLKIPSHEVSWQRASKCRRSHAMIGSTGSLPNQENRSKPTDLLPLHLHLMHLVVVLDTEASNHRKSIAAK